MGSIATVSDVRCRTTASNGTVHLHASSDRVMEGSCNGRRWYDAYNGLVLAKTERNPAVQAPFSPFRRPPGPTGTSAFSARAALPS